MTIEEFKQSIGHKKPADVAETVGCYCGRAAHGRFVDLRNQGWQWLVSWWGWACPACRPLRRQQRCNSCKASWFASAFDEDGRPRALTNCPVCGATP